MGKYMSVIIGAVIALVGLILLLNWWDDFLSVIKGSIPAMLIFGGVIAAIAGVSEIKDELTSGTKQEKK